jgi:hypothetical protein
MRFEWDEAKRGSNLAKHGVDFLLAQEVFMDAQAMVLADPRSDYGESRFRAIGAAQGLILFVAFTVRGDAVRLISARKAHRREREAYRKAHRA